MTREKAARILYNQWQGFLEDNIDYAGVSDAYEMAIKVLEQEPCEDAIDRAEAMTEIMMFAGNVKSDEEDIYIKVSDAVQLLRELPSVTPQYTDAEIQKMQELEQAEIEKAYELGKAEQPEIGYWIKHTWDSFECSICHNEGGFYSERKSPYCPDCGAKMESEVEE